MLHVPFQMLQTSSYPLIPTSPLRLCVSARKTQPIMLRCRHSETSENRKAVQNYRPTVRPPSLRPGLHLPISPRSLTKGM